MKYDRAFMSEDELREYVESVDEHALLTPAEQRAIFNIKYNETLLLMEEVKHLLSERMRLIRLLNEQNTNHYHAINELYDTIEADRNHCLYHSKDYSLKEISKYGAVLEAFRDIYTDEREHRNEKLARGYVNLAKHHEDIRKNKNEYPHMTRELRLGPGSIMVGIGLALTAAIIVMAILVNPMAWAATIVGLASVGLGFSGGGVIERFRPKLPPHKQSTFRTYSKCLSNSLLLFSPGKMADKLSPKNYGSLEDSPPPAYEALAP